MQRPPSPQQTSNSNIACSSSSSDRKPYLGVHNVPAGFKEKRLKKLFGANDVEIDRENRHAMLYFDSIENGIKGLRFNCMKLLDSQILVDWEGPEFTWTIFVQGFSSSLKHSSFLKHNKIHNIFDLKKNQIHNMLVRHFRSCGAITRIAIPTLPKSGEVKGYVDGFKLQVKLAHPKRGRHRKSSIFSRSTGTKIKLSDSDDEDQMPKKNKIWR